MSAARDHVAEALGLLAEARPTAARRRNQKRAEWKRAALREIAGDLRRLLDAGVPAEPGVLGALTRSHDRIAKLAPQLGEGRSAARHAVFALRRAERALEPDMPGRRG